jgi:hypothetical protein
VYQRRSGTKDQLLIDRTVCNDSIRRRIRFRLIHNIMEKRTDSKPIYKQLATWYKPCCEQTGCQKNRECLEKY